MYRHLLIAAVLGLAACTTPAERCVTEASKGTVELDAQIAEARLNIQRGYRIDDPVIATVNLGACTGGNGLRLCVDSSRDIPGKQIPINVADERARLAALENQRATEIARMDRQLAACQAL